MGVGAISRTLEINGVLGELKDDGGGLRGLGLVEVTVVIHKGLLVTGADTGVKKLARVTGVVEWLLRGFLIKNEDEKYVTIIEISSPIPPLLHCRPSTSHSRIPHQEIVRHPGSQNRQNQR